ncbi:uncharacterized protein LOC128727157 [Anopheles nili]|uniref:uncharacterized protein LOC128727157 n=1 Tax=Anopheles nili TaxID=185578 RepID=UPI00237B1CE9|nr:uncharacterized protein LOC128727157 [Anopheles nili]
MFSSTRRSASVDRRVLTQLTRWCTLFIILESTSVGSSLITSTSTTASSPTSTSAPAGVTSSSSSTTTSSSSTSSSKWLEGTSPSGVGERFTTVPSLEVLPHFEALVQDSPNGSRGKTLPLLGSGALKATKASPSGSSSSSSSSSSVGSIESLTSARRMVPVKELPPASVTTPGPSLSVSGSNGSSSFSKITSANLILAEGGGRGVDTSKLGPGQKLPAGFSGSTAAGKASGKAKGASEQDPSGAANRLDGPDVTATEGNFSKMYFETENHTTIASQVGSIAVLPCAVRNIGEGVVSWIRRKDYHLLTIGVTTYSSDERFNIIHSEDAEEWPLQIKYVQLRDAGLYECQVSTHPPTSIFVKLDVIEAKAEIFGPSEKYLKPGSMLRLTCRVVQSNEPPLYIFWYHNNRMINYDAHRGVNVSTEADNRYSELVISHTNTLNSGNYSCVSNNAVAASTLVHILNGENPAAMQHGDHGNAVLVASHIHLPLAVVTYQVINFVFNLH